MAEIRSLKRKKNYDNDGRVSWSDLNHDVLLLVMMQLGVIDFVSFSGVCKSWRSLALSNRNMFMGSRLPMAISISTDDNEKDNLYLEDFEGKEFKTLLPHSNGRACVGLTCGYLILFGKKTRDFCLVNPITRHQLHFPDSPYGAPFLFNNFLHFMRIRAIRAILVFSPSISEWLLVITQRLHDQIWFSVAGKGVWNHVHVSTTSGILGLHAFKGKIYTLVIDFLTREKKLHEMRLGTEPKLMLLKTNNFPNSKSFPEFASSDETLHLLTYFSGYVYKIHKLDFGEMKWVCLEKANEEYAFYINSMNHMTTVVKRQSLAGTVKSQKCIPDLWYFPNECLNVNLMDES